MRSISFLGRRSPSAPQMELDARDESFYYRARFDLFVHAFAHGLKPLSRQEQTLEVGKSKEWRNPRVNIPHGICLSFNSSLGNTCRFRGSAQRSSSLFALRSSSRLSRPMVLSSCAGASAEALIPAPCKQRREETQCNGHLG